MQLITNLTARSGTLAKADHSTRNPFPLITAFVPSRAIYCTHTLNITVQVYTFFLGVYRASKVVGVLGYCLVLAEVFGLGPLLHFVLPRDLPIDLVWYGLYFGILGRDCAQVATDSLSARLGIEGRQLVSRVNNCGICGNELCDELVPASGSGEAAPPSALAASERTVQLSCKHCFHDLCVRGWTMVGKKVRQVAGRELQISFQQVGLSLDRWDGGIGLRRNFSLCSRRCDSGL